MRQRLRHLWRERSGSTAAEFALIAPALLLLLLGLVESGRMIWTQSVLHFAVENAARCASVDTATCGDTASIQSYAVGRAGGLSLDSSVFSVSTPACGNQVSASYAFQTAVGSLLPFNVTLTAQSCFPR